MTESVAKPCTVEALDGDVVIECGTAATSLSPDVARDAGQRLIEESEKAVAMRRASGK